MWNINQQKQGGKQTLNLKTALIGDPFVSPIRQRMNTHLIAKDSGLADPIHLRQVAAIKRTCERLIATDWVNADEPCTGILDYLGQMNGDVCNYDATIFDADLDAQQEPFESYLKAATNAQSAELYKALHVDKSTKSPVFQRSNHKVY